MTERFEGHEGRECGDHDSTGRRAWCSWCTEWCYPHAPCKGCEMPALRKRCEQAEADRDALAHRLTVRADAIADERRGRLAAEAAVRRVRELHRRNANTGDCEHCSERDYPDYAVPHPCPTIAALDAEQPKETP